MRQQFSGVQSLQQESDFITQHVQQNQTNFAFGNGIAQERFNLVLDVNSWLDIQLQMVANMNHDVQTERVNGIMSVLQMVNQSYKDGNEVNVSQLPFAPKATEKPDMSGLMPELKSALTEFHMSLAVQQKSSLAASLFGAVNTDDGAVDQGLLVASASDTGVDTSLLTLATKVNELRLKLQDETGTFALSKYGDFSSIRIILNECLTMGIRSPDQVAYILSTAWIESRMGKWMTESAWLSQSSAERHGEREYGPNGRRASEARSLGNTQSGDGARYMGRGYVQITWKNNYRRMSNLLKDSGYTYTHNGVTYGNGQNGTQPIDLVANYRHVNENKALAARILVFGMDGGHFAQNGGLDDYIPEGQQATHANFQNARRIVNGSDKKRLIADNAVTIAAKLRDGDAWVKLFAQ